MWSRKQTFALILTILGIANVSFFKNATATGNYAITAIDAEDATNLLRLTTASAVETIADSDGVSDFYRYSGRTMSCNVGLLSKISSTDYYWSISNPAVNLFRSIMELREPSAFAYEGYDDRTALITLSSVRYYVVPARDDAPVPYGFTYVGTINVNENITAEAKAFLLDELETESLSEAQIRIIEDATEAKYKIYRNDYALPLTYTYDAVISQDAWSRLSTVEKQETMLQSILLAGYDGQFQNDGANYRNQSLDYSIDCNGNGVTLEDYGFVVTAPNSSVTINFDGLANSETYFSIKELDFDGVTDYELYFGNEKYDPLNLFTKTRWNLLPHADRESAKRNWLFWTEPTGADLKLKSSTDVYKTINYYTDDFSWYNDRHDFTINLDYAENPVTSITITFSAIGVYSFDSIEIICQPMSDYTEQVNALKETVLENVEIGTDTICGTISLDRPQILCFSVPYSIGWTALVDGEEATLYQANIKNMALALDAGEHDIRLVYHTPFLRLGIGVSVVGFLVFGILVIGDLYKKRKERGLL